MFQMTKFRRGVPFVFKYETECPILGGSAGKKAVRVAVPL